MSSSTTMLSNLIDPEVIANFVDKKLINAIKLAPLATVRNDLVGKAGDEVTLPEWAYIGAAGTVAEAGEIETANLSQTSNKVKIHKIAKGVAFTDESILSGLGGNEVQSQAVDQIVKSIADKVESELLAKMDTDAQLTYAYSATKDVAENIALALEKFGEDIDGQKVLLLPPSKYSTVVGAKGWIPNTEMGGNILVKGTVGQIMGCDIVISARVTNAYIVKPNALALFSKRDTMVEFDRDPSTQVNYVYGSKLYAPYVYDKSKLIKITFA